MCQSQNCVLLLRSLHSTCMHYVLGNEMITKAKCLALKWLIIQVWGTATH